LQFAPRAVLVLSPVARIQFWLTCYPAESIALISCETSAQIHFPSTCSIKPTSMPGSITFSDFLSRLELNSLLCRNSFSSETVHLLRSGLTTQGFRVLHVTALPSCCPFVYPRGVTSGTKCHSGTRHKPRKVSASFPVQFRAETLLFPEPCDSLFERTFPLFSDFLNIPGPGPSSSDFGSHDAQTRRSD
jgi:hypothetical protein